MAERTLRVGQTIQLQVLYQSDRSVGPAVDDDVSWSSSDEDVATVEAASVMGGTGSSSSSAHVTGIAYGDVTITATIEETSVDFPLTVLGSEAVGSGFIISQVG